MKNYNNEELSIVYLDYLGVSRKKILEIMKLTKSVYSAIKSPTKEVEYLVGEERIEKIGLTPVDVTLKNLKDYLSGEQVFVSTILSEDFPSKLKEIDDPPVVIYYSGDFSLLETKPLLGVVGTRKPTSYGKSVIEKFLKELVGELNIITISGLAYGIDSEVARQTLSNNGKTIAVLGGGIKKIYPSSNVGLAERIVFNGGLVLSEYFPTFKPTQYTFPERNRVISGLSDGVMVVEAGLKSGSLITANFAIDQGKELFVVPGDINNVNCLGSNKLIEELPHSFTSSTAPIKRAFHLINTEKEKVKVQLSFEEEAVVSVLESGDKNIDDLCEILREDFQNLNLLLTEMEIRGIIKKLPGDYYSLG